jgi:hypothetical protein
MQIVLTLNKDIAPHIADLILDEKLEGGYSIDYALNALVSFLNGKEIIIYNFTKYFWLDNRWSGYKIDNYGTKIVINFI